MAYVDYATYVIFFHDRNEYDFAVAAVGGTPETGGLFDGSPFHAAEYFDIPYPFPSGNMDDIDKGVYYNSGYFPGKELNNFAPPNVIMNEVTDEYTVPGYPGSPGFAGAGQSRTIRWSGVLIYMQGAAATTPVPTPIAQRRWVMGFETIHNLEGSGGNSNGNNSREASRTLEGQGYAVRRGNGNTQLATQFMLSTYGITTHKSWERMYFRPRVVGTGPVCFWRCRGSSSPAQGICLVLTTSGNLAMYSVSSGTVATLIYTGPVLNMMEWYKIDIIFRFATSGPDSGVAMLFLNGVLLVTNSGSSGTDGLDGVGNHTQSDYGKGAAISALGASDGQVEFDLDDAFNAAWPENVGVLMFDGLDWLTGSHIRRTFVSALSQTGWTPVASNIVNQGAIGDTALNSELTSTTSGALLQGTVEIPALGVQDRFGEVAIGPVAAVVATLSRNLGVGDGSLGYNVAGAGNVMSVIAESGILGAFVKTFAPSGLIEPAEMNPFLVRYTKSADANSAFVRVLQATLEYLGIWGPEDCIDPSLYPSDRPRTSWLHNCNYPNTPYGLMGPTLETLVFVKAGTYVGNGTQQDIALPDACHVIFLRGLTASDTNGMKWMACSIGGHLGTTERVIPNTPIRVYYDSVAGAFKFTVTGTGAQFNQSGVTYQYIAICDPGMRYTCGGAFNVGQNQARTHDLQNPDFTPEFMIVQRDQLTASNIIGTWCKGPGNTGAAGNQFDSPSVAVDFGTFGAGFYTNGNTITDTQLIQDNYMAFRSIQPDCGYVMFQIFTYTGNGVSPRNITLTPASNRFPVFVLVVATSGTQAAYFRDPSHTGSNSSRFHNPNTTDTNGITGSSAIDQITVQANLNANGVIYNVFAIPGDTVTPWLNGTYFPPNCDNPDPWFNPPQIPPEIAILAEGGLVLNGTVPLTLLQDVSGIYTLVPGKTNDTLYDRQTGQPSVDVEIPDPTAKTGFVGG